MRFRASFALGMSAWIALITVLLLFDPAIGRLPDPIATSSTGEGPSGRMPIEMFRAMLLIFWAAIVLLGAGVLHSGGIRLRPQRIGSALILAIGGTYVAGAYALTLWANWGVPHWTAARPMTWHFLLVVGACVPAGWLGWLLASLGPNERVSSADHRPAERVVVAGQHPVWVSVTSSTGRRMLGMVPGVVALVGAVLGTFRYGWDPSLLIVFGIGGLLALTLSSVRTQIDQHGVRLAFGPLRWPRRRVSLQRIERAGVEHRRPRDVGGWGWTGLPGGGTIMVRPGDCLILHYRDGTQLAVSADGAERGAALLNALIVEHGPRGPVR